MIGWIFSGCDEGPAVLFQSLIQMDYSNLHSKTPLGPAPNDMISGMIAAGLKAQETKEPMALVLPDTPEGNWTGKLAHWLYGPRGPKVSMGKAPKSGYPSVIKIGFKKITV